MSAHGLFGGPDAFAARAAQRIPGMADLHQMAAVQLAERAPAKARMLVRGAGGGLGLRAFALSCPDWRLEGVAPSGDMLQHARPTLGDPGARSCLRRGHIDDAPEGPFGGASCLVTPPLRERAERKRTLAELYLRRAPGCPLAVVHHRCSKDDWQNDVQPVRHAARLFNAGLPAAHARKGARSLRGRLPSLTPEDDTALLREAGLANMQLFYAAFTLRGWVAYRPN